jgi:hypothetical protein
MLTVTLCTSVVQTNSLEGNEFLSLRQESSFGWMGGEDEEGRDREHNCNEATGEEDDLIGVQLVGDNMSKTIGHNTANDC